MKVYHKEFAEMHKAMSVWCKRQGQEGWQNPEVQHWAIFVALSLWGLAHNEENPPVAFAALAEYTEKLERSAQ